MREYMIAFLKKNKFVSACICTLLVFVFFFLLNSFWIGYPVGDDYKLSLLLSHGDNEILFVGVFLTKLLSVFQKVLPQWNIFLLFCILLGLISFSIINYVIIEKYQVRFGLPLALIFNFLFLKNTVIEIQWTQTATISCLSGFVLLYYCVQYEKRKRIRVIQLLGAILLLLFGSQLRVDSAKVCFVFACIYLIINFIISIINCKEKKLRAKTFCAVRSFSFVFLSTVIVFVSCFSLIGLSNYIKNSDKEYYSFRQYNSAKSDVFDYPHVPYSGNEKFYSSVGIETPKEFDFFCNTIDKDMYSIEDLNAISKYSAEHDSGKLNIYLLYFRFLQNKIQTVFGNGIFVYPVFLLSILVVLGLCFLLYKHREKFKPLFFVLFIVLWVAFFVFSVKTNIDILIISFFLISMFIAVLGNRYQYFGLFVIDISVMLLYHYMKFYRLSFRVEYTFIIPSVVFLLLLFKFSDIRKSLLLFRIKSERNKKVINFLLCSVFIFTVLCQSYFSLGNSFHNKALKVDEELLNFINTNSDCAFFHNWSVCKYIDQNQTNPYLASTTPDNCIHFGGWPMFSHYYEQQLRNHNITHLFRDAINNEKCRFIISKEDMQYKELLLEHYNLNYSINGNVTLQEVLSTDYVIVFQVVES